VFIQRNHMPAARLSTIIINRAQLPREPADVKSLIGVKEDEQS
jgi:hypothetical protein